MTKKDLESSIKIVNYLNNNKEDVYSTSYLKNVLELPESYIIYLLKEFIIPNKILTNNGTVKTGFAIMTNNLTDFLIEDKKLEKLYFEKKADENDKIHKRSWNKYKANSFWPLFLISIFAGIYSGVDFISSFKNEKIDLNNYVEKNEYEKELNKLKLEIIELKKIDTIKIIE
jgi:hypothetical protein